MVVGNDPVFIGSGGQVGVSYLASQVRHPLGLTDQGFFILEGNFGTGQSLDLLICPIQCTGVDIGYLEQYIAKAILIDNNKQIDWSGGIIIAFHQQLELIGSFGHCCRG